MNDMGKGKRKIHPALDFLANSAVVGIVDAQRQARLVNSEGQQHSAMELHRQGALTVAPFAYDGVAGRWDAADLESFIAGEPGSTFGAVLGEVVDVINCHVALRQPQQASLVACWIVGTYLFPLFPAFPRLNLHGERGTGKSKLLQVIACLAFNGLHRISPTPAVLLRLIGPLRPTFCLDEMEGLAKNDRQEIFAILNAGYKAGMGVERVEGEAGNRHVATYAVYAPIALAGIAGLNATTTDRAITLTMERGRDLAKLNRPVIQEDPTFAALRAGCYRLALTYFTAVRQAWEGLNLPTWLVARHRELYAPLLTIATLADEEANLGVTGDLLALAKEEVDERGGVSPDGDALFQILEEQLRARDSIIVRPKELAAKLSPWLETKVSPEQAGQLLIRYGFRSKGRDKSGKRYPVSREALTKVMAMYGYEAPVFG